MHGSFVSRHAAMIGRAAFFEPLIAISPFSACCPCTKKFGIATAILAGISLIQKCKKLLPYGVFSL